MRCLCKFLQLKKLYLISLYGINIFNRKISYPRSRISKSSTASAWVLDRSQDRWLYITAQKLCSQQDKTAKTRSIRYIQSNKLTYDTYFSCLQQYFRYCVNQHHDKLFVTTAVERKYFCSTKVVSKLVFTFRFNHGSTNQTFKF